MALEEHHVLDSLARGLADRSVTRRQALKLVAAGAAAALLSLVGAREVAAAKPTCQELFEPCNEHLPCCSVNTPEGVIQLVCVPFSVREPARDERGLRRCNFP